MLPFKLNSCVHYIRSERRFKETQAQMEEEKSAAQRLQDQVNSLNTKIRNLKRDKEDSESEVEGLQRKLRQAKSSLDDAEEQISTLQTQLNKTRAGARAKPKVCLITCVQVTVSVIKVYLCIMNCLIERIFVC